MDKLNTRKRMCKTFYQAFVASAITGLATLQQTGDLTISGIVIVATGSLAAAISAIENALRNRSRPGPVEET